MLERMGMQLVSEGRSALDIVGEVCYNVSSAVEEPPPHERLSATAQAFFAERGVHPAIFNLIEETVYETDDGLLFFFPDEDYWQVRRWKHLGNPRWSNPKVSTRSPAKGVSYHLRCRFDSSIVVLVEGIFDVLRVAPFANVAATLSSNIHDTQALALYDRGYRSVIYMPDGDVSITKRIANNNLLGAHFDRVIITEPNGADDPGSATDGELQDAVQSAVRFMSAT
jgi:hypothetical protein